MSKSLTIGQVAAATGVSPYTLRYYEQEGVLLPVGRTAAGHRLYSPADLDWLQFVMRLKATGMPIASIKAFAALRAHGASTYDERREMLVAHRDDVLRRLAELQASLAAIVDKIGWYDAAASDAKRHDGTFHAPQTEKDSQWTPQSRRGNPIPTATRKGGRN